MKPGIPLSMNGDTILETRGLTKEFKGFVAVDKVDLKVQRGAIHALIAPTARARPPLSIS